MLSSVIQDRTVNKLGLSVATALGLETIFKDMEPFDKDRDIPTQVDPNEFKYHIFNVYTLFRNVVNSIKYKEKDILMSNHLVQEQLVNDIYLILELYSNTGIVPIFILPDYSTVYKQLNLKKDKSPYKPYIIHMFMVKCLRLLKLPVDTLNKNIIGSIPRTNDKVLLLTHYTVDLLNVEVCPNLTLLESHTGKLKTKLEWGKKYHPIGKRDLTILPIDKGILYILGDRSLVRPLGISDRKAFYEIAVVKNINPAMSRSAVKKIVTSFRSDIKM